MPRALRADGRPRGTLARRPKNVAEGACWDRLVEAGWEPWKKGWPDFIAFRGDEVCVIEVKPSGTGRLTRAQARVMSVLAAAGISCWRFSPDAGLQRRERPKEKGAERAAS